MIQRFHL